MRTQIALVLTAGLLLVGCGQSEPAKTPAPAPAPAATPAKEAAKKEDATSGGGYLGAIARAKKTAEGTIDTAALTQQVQLFYGQEGRYPKDLNELVTMNYIKSLPAAPYGMKLDYDATKGTVTVVKQ